MDIFETIDNLFEKSPKEAEQYMLSELERAKAQGDSDISLKLYNELIGYYRQTSNSDKLCQIIDDVCKLLEETKADGTLDYATTMLNIANAYRSIGRYEDSIAYYSKTEAIYNQAIIDKLLSADDLCVAGLYNNMSLLYQELGDYQKSEELLQKALFIVNKKQEKFEIAVTYANLANTMLLAKDYESSYRYAKEAITRFKARNYIDAHYCAALSAMATCYYEWGDVNRAHSIFARAMLIVESTIGINSQYERLRENVKMCENHPQFKTSIKGMELSRKYFEEYGRSMIEEKFSKYCDKITIGLVGEGSDCYQFDDEYSNDHDFGPEFCIFVDDEIYEEISDDLINAYESLPNEFMGYTRNRTPLGQKRRGVIKTSDFYRMHLGTSVYEEIDFTAVSDYELAVCTNGQIFVGAGTDFLKLRERLSNGYPQKIRLLKLAEDVSKISQYGQYNYNRMQRRGDDFTAKLMLAEFCKKVMLTYHHLMNAFPPHDKWLKVSTLRLQGGEELIALLEKITCMSDIGESLEAITGAVEDVGTYLALKLYENHDISDIDSYLANHSAELMFKSSIVECSVDELVDKIVHIEFEAFDKVENEGGRASCQNNFPTFSVMRKSQYLTWNKDMLVQYLYDFTREYKRGHNLITEKYGRMMESTAPERYEKIKDYFPKLSEQKKAIIEQIVGVQMSMADEFGEGYPKLANNARSFHSYEDNYINTSYETYLRGEISTYSDKMLQLYAGFVVSCAKNGINIAKITIENTARLYGFKDLDEFNRV